MVKLGYLEAGDTYKTKPPIIAPESKDNRKKNQAYMMIAPNIETELRFLSSTKVFRFRDLYKYYIDKKWDHTLYGQGHKVINMNADGEITALVEQYKHGNLAQVDGVTSYLPNVKTNTLKNLNVLVEMNHVTDFIMNNPKDRRLISLKVKECFNEYYRIIYSAINTLGYGNVSVFIPVELWWSESDLRNLTKKMKPAEKDFLGQFIALITNYTNMIKLCAYDSVTLYFTYGNVVLPINNTIKEDTDLLDMFRRFTIKALQASGTTSVEESDDLVLDQDSEDVAELKLQKAEAETKKDLVAGAVIDKATGGNGASAAATSKVKAVTDKKADAAKVTVNDETNEIEVDLSQLAIDDKEADVVLAAKMEGRSVASVQRNEQLKVKYKELKMGNQPISTVIEPQKSEPIPATPIKANVANETLRSVKANQFERAYNENVASRDMANILLHFSHAHPAMYLNKDIQIDDISTPTDRILRYTVEFEDEDRKRHRFSFKMPKMYKEKYLYLADQQLNIVHQKLPFPVTKVSPDMCQAVTNYKKIFTERYGGNISPRITKLKKIFSGTECPNFAKVDRGNANALNTHYLTTIEYDEIGSEILKLTLGNPNDLTRIMFAIDDASVMIDANGAPKLDDPKETQSLMPLAIRKVKQNPSYFYHSGITNKVYDQLGNCYGELSEFIVTAASWYDPKFKDSFDTISPGTKFVYSRSRVLHTDIPLILVLGAADPGGLLSVLEKAQLNYEFTEKRPVVDKNERGVIAFADGYLTFDRYPYENSLLMNGLQTIPTKEFNFDDFGTRDTYVELFDMMYGRRNIYDGLQTFYYMFVDPITMDILVRLNMPTDFTRIMLYCNDILADNTYQIDSDYHNSRLRSNEIIYAYLYTELADAWGRYKDGKAEKFSIPEDVVIKKCLTSNIVDPHSELNLTLEAENDRQVKLKGPSGMNEDHSFTLEKRAYHPSMTGIIGMNSTPSGGVGINRHMTLNPNILDDRGFVEIEKSEYDGTEMLTPGEMMQPFGPEAADVERLAMAISQSKHVVPVDDSGASLVTYDMERVIPYISTDFARTAKLDGTVVAIENDVMIIKYTDGTVDDIDLSERPARNTDGGFYIMNQLSTNLKPGSKVKQGDLIAYDKKYIDNTRDMFGDPVANVGTLTRIAVETNGGVYEDACYITDGLAHRMATKITKQKRVILSKYANIKYMAKIGQEVKANDQILVFDDTADEFSSQMLASMAEEVGDEDEVIATSAPVVTKITGVIRDIRIYYTIPLEEMTPSMRKIVETYAKEARTREKTISKYKSINDATTIVKTSEMLVPDSQGKVKGVKIDNGIFIDFYIEYLDVMAPGDKLTFFTALKGIVSDIIPEEEAAYTESNPDRKIQACLSCIGVYKRMCLDVCKVGMLTKILVEKKRLLKEQYGDRIKAELKK